MERNNMKHLGRSIKDKNTKDSSSTTSWDQCYSCCESTTHGGAGGDHLLMMSGLISWPPRSYTCNFCKREFRSAQALGGHMNVHRRDRARLRHYSPPPSPRNNGFNLNLSPNPNPNPNSSSSSPPHSTLGLITPSMASLSQLLSPTTLSSPSSLSLSEMTKWGMSGNSTTTTTPLQLLRNSPFPKALFSDQCGVLKKKKKGEFNVRLDLEIGLLSASANAKEDLDLELRLGCS